VLGGADPAWNADRVMRVPGTVNWPNKPKRDAGRVPTMARLLHASGRTYSWPAIAEEIAALEDEPPAHAVKVEHRPRSHAPNGPDLGGDMPPYPTEEQLAALLENHPEIALVWHQTCAPPPNGTPNAWDQRFASMLARRGYAPERVGSFLRAYRNQHEPDKGKQDRPDYIRRTVETAFSFDDDAPPFEAGNGAAVGEPKATIEPLDIIGAPELTGWPELTADCLPQALHRYVIAEAERLNTDPCPLAAHVIAACATSISDAWHVKPKRHDHWTQQPRIWSCVVKDVGARGSDTLRSAFWTIRERDRSLYDQWRAAYDQWQERQAARKGKSAPDDPAPHCPRLITQDATVEAASDILKYGGDHAKLALVCDELVAFLGGFNRYSPVGGAARALWLEAYDGGPQRIDRVKRGHVFVRNWSAVIAGNIQPRRLIGMGKDLIDDGLFQRFLTTHTKPPTLGKDDDDTPLDVSGGANYRDLHTILAELEPAIGAEGKPMPAYFDDDARAVRRTFVPLIERLQVDPTLPTIIRETAPKWSGLLARLSLIFHCVDLAEQKRMGSQPEPRDFCRVTGPTVTAAATFLRRIALPNLFRLGFETMPEEGAPTAHARWLAGYILAHQAEHISTREIGRAHRPLRGKAPEIEQAMAVLCDAGWATPAAQHRHDGARWAVNPAVHTIFARAAAAEKQRREHVLAAIRNRVSEL
jgi:hypothetical protein